MVKAKIEEKLKNDPLSVIIVILVFTVLSLGILVYMHVVQASEIRQLRADTEKAFQQLER